jgi:1-acyl-sn-glycerol-3-phosphate acyltransferase
MKLFKYLFWTIWRSWFAVWGAIVTIVVSPFMFVFLIDDRTFHLFSKALKIWSSAILFGMGFYLKAVGNKPKLSQNSYIYIANHTSVLDILMMISISEKPLVFVGKKELSKIPLFGYFYKKTCVLVDRSSHKSRVGVYQGISKKIDEGKSICIFPEGLVSEDESIVLCPFRVGAFKIAIDHKLNIIPVVLKDCKARYSFTFFSGSPGKLRYAYLDLISQNNFDNPREMRDEAFDQFYAYLTQDK